MRDLESTGRTRVADATASAGPLVDLVIGMKPVVIPETSGFWDGTVVQELRIQKCNACGNTQLPGGPCCANCLSQDLTWVKSNGTGRVFSFSIVHQALHPSFMDRVPYVVADIQLDEGPIVLSNVTDVDPHDVRIGLRVAVWFDEQDTDAFGVPFRLPKFKPSEQ
ncbi:MAG: Zn-ribbon domain-containing OB-fold protein [Actinomycetota bacterium]|nr:Zn-ribbon domain-containing OB-fold protein [Actinomycetota bacterium]